MAPRSPRKSAAPLRWINRPSIDLVVGCGAWTLPLLLLAGGALTARTWSVAFYLLALAINYPHYMATVYRAYHSSATFSQHRFFTFYVTIALVALAIASHLWAPLVPIIFTVYVTWSPWHYTAQNFGLTMMFARRNGIAPTSGERRGLHIAFVASYLLLFVSLHTGVSSDPLIRSIGIAPATAVPVQWVLLLVASLAGITAIGRMVARSGLAAMAAPLTLVSTQMLWFVLPVIATGLGSGQSSQTRYSTGVLAVMHSMQYLWIAGFHAKREAETSTDAWQPWRYAAILVAGGIALFVPWPWIASYVFHADFTESLLIVTAIVNIHHFVLDGVIWKLRDRRVGSLLVGATERTASHADDAGDAAGWSSRWPSGAWIHSRRVRLAVASALVAWAVLDQARFIWGTNAESADALRRAARLNPYDSSVWRRQARLSLEQRQYPDADVSFRQVLQRYPNDAEALISTGLLAAQLGNEDEAERRWDAAATQSSAVLAHRLLAQLWARRADRFDAEGREKDAAHAFQRTLSLDEQNGDTAALGADWFNYGQFLKRRLAQPSLVLACLLRAEELLAGNGDARAETVRSARVAIEREFPSAAEEARRSAGDLLDAARTRF